MLYTHSQGISKLGNISHPLCPTLDELEGVILVSLFSVDTSVHLSVHLQSVTSFVSRSISSTVRLAPIVRRCVTYLLFSEIKKLIFDDFITLPWSFDNVLGMFKSIPDLNVYDSHLSCISEKYVTA